MLSYSIAKLGREAGRKPGTKATLPIIQARLSTEREYHVALRKVLALAAKEVHESIIPAYQAGLEGKRRQSAIAEDGDRSWFTRLKQVIKSATTTAEQKVERLLVRGASHHTDRFTANAKRAIGIDLSAVVRKEDLEGYLRTVSGRNASLITSLGDDILRRVEQAVYSNFVAGNSAKALKKELEGQFGILDKRAKLIARDQTSKLSSDLDRIRQEQAGITEYTWSTAHDERVRERHRALDGKVYKWGKPTGAEEGLPPGQPVLCRCIAQAIVSFDEDGPKKSRARRSEKPPHAQVQNDDRAKEYVVSSGLKDGSEHLVAYVEGSGELISRHSDGSKSSVSLPQSLLDALEANKEVTVHHNHPRGSSFSLADLQLITGANTLVRLWAHGHNGSSYLATPTHKALPQDAYKRQYNAVIGKLSSLYARKIITEAEFNLIAHHLINKRLSELGYFKYEYTLTDEASALEKRIEKWL